MYYDHATLEPAVEMFKSKQYASRLFVQTSTLNASLQRTAIKLERPLQRRDPDKKNGFAFLKKLRQTATTTRRCQKYVLFDNDTWYATTVSFCREHTIRMLTKTFVYALIFSTYISERNHFSLTYNFLDNDND